MFGDPKMNAFLNRENKRRERGQTLVIALIVLSVLLVLAFVFLGLINRNIRSTGTAQNRSLANDLAVAGINYAHAQMLTSELGADWRGTPTYTLATTGLDISFDPDIAYLRPGTGFGFRSDTDSVTDLGGPDGLGPYVRINFASGRALVRVRYGPSDANIFSNSPTGALRNPGAVRNYLIIESVGRSGKVIPNDPTTVNKTGGIQYRNFGNSTNFRQALAQIAQADNQIATSRKLIAFQPIGITDHSLFITNKDRVNRPAEIGVPSELGSSYYDDATSSSVSIASLPTLFGGKSTVPDGNGAPVSNISSSGSVFSNADLKLYGNTRVFLNASLGESFDVAGVILGTSGSSLDVFRSSRNPDGTWTDPGVNPTATLAAGPIAGKTVLPLNSRDPLFSTVNGVVRDGLARTDFNGFPRGVGRQEPPSILTTDPATNESRYVELTRESGFLSNGVNTGRFGHGRGVYVDNFFDRQNPADDAGRANAGSEASLVYDWLNPNNTQARSGWQGPYYVPPGSYVQFLPDGFVILRDNSAPASQRFWSDYSGNSTGSSLIRYRLGRATDGTLRIVDSQTPGVSINSATLAASDFDHGFPFNGVLYFEGNVRLRGVIPTDIQLTVVSNATIYIEGSLTKGVIGTQWTASRSGSISGLPSIPINARITYAPQSMLLLAAKDYVTLNTSMFFGPEPTQVIEAVNDVPADEQIKPLRLRPDGQVTLACEFVLNSQPTLEHPEINPANPSTWRPFVADYVDPASSGTKMQTRMLLTHTMDNGPAASTFVSMLVNCTSNAAPATYYFPVTTSTAFFSGTFFNGAYQPYLNLVGGNPTTIPVWGLGGETWQRYSKFESVAFPLVDPSNLTLSADGSSMTSTGINGSFSLRTTDSNEFLLRPYFFPGIATNDYLLGRSAITPHDVRIEASIYAEEGSFFVIPGSWLNPNSNDRHDSYAESGANDAERQRNRIENYGANPEFPFYGEPPDVRVSLVGSVSENMPAPISEQAEWIRKWGWIPRRHGASGENIPRSHVPVGYDVTQPTPANSFVPNLIVNYDPVLATANTVGYVSANPSNAIRTDEFGRVLPPIPRLPVSPALAYFGEVQ